MPSKFNSSGSESSPEKSKINVEKRKSLRDLPGRSTNLYTQLPKSPVVAKSNETSRSPLRNRNDRENFSDEEVEENFRPRAGSYTENARIRLESNCRMSPSPVPETFRHRTPAPPVQKPPPKSNTQCIIYAFVIVILAAVAASFVDFSKTTKNVVKAQRDCSLFMDLQNNFPDQDRKLFKSLKVGVEGMMNGEPMVMSLFSTEISVIDDVMAQVIKATQKCINQSQDPLSLSSEHLGPKMVENYKQELQRRSIMIINNVEEALPSTVPSLHSFCDTYNPLVSHSIIFITIKVPAKPQGKPVEYITDFLNQQWRTLPDHVRSPLITRILDQTFFLNP